MALVRGEVAAAVVNDVDFLLFFIDGDIIDYLFLLFFYFFLPSIKVVTFYLIPIFLCLFSLMMYST